MKRFLIQDRYYYHHLPYDFQHELQVQLEQCKEDFSWCFAGGDDGLFHGEHDIPVGSVEFVIGYLKKNYKIDYKPLNIPDCLLISKYMGRYQFGFKTGQEIIESNNNLFFKDWTTIKGELGFTNWDKPETLDKSYFYRELFDIESEWRVFVHRNEILDVRCYTGNPWKLPSKELALEIVNTFKEEAPIAYTLDLAITEKGETVIIELHHYFSCGTYGFNSPKHPYMLSQAWFELLKNQKK